MEKCDNRLRKNGRESEYLVGKRGGLKKQIGAIFD
jgi:hypothetical protein